MNNVKKYRKLRNISQDKLAEMVGLKGRGYLAQCETGARKLSLSLAHRIANALGVDVYDLLGDDLLKAELTGPGDKSKALASLTKSGSASFTESFSSLVDSYLYLFQTTEFVSKKDEVLFSLAFKVSESLDGFSEDDIKDLYILVSQFVDGRGVKHRQAVADFAEDIEKGDE